MVMVIMGLRQIFGNGLGMESKLQITKPELDKTQTNVKLLLHFERRVQSAITGPQYKPMLNCH